MADSAASMEPDTPSSSQHSHLLELPAELRNRIYDLALYHSENNGVIAPSALIEHDDPSLRLFQAPKGQVSIDGVWRTAYRFHGKASYESICDIAGVVDEDEDDENGDDGTTDMDPRVLLRSIAGADADRLQVERLDVKGYRFVQETGVAYKEFVQDDGKDRYVYLDETNTTRVHDGHVCTADCLRTPALVQTNRQVRSESLQLSQATNRISIDAQKLSLPECKAIVGWWRTLGDQGLRNVPTFSLTAKNGAFTYSEAENRIILQRSHISMDLNSTLGVAVSRYMPQRKLWARALPILVHPLEWSQLRLMQWIQQARLCVQVLEQVFLYLDSEKAAMCQAVGSNGDALAKEVRAEVKAAEWRHERAFPCW